MSGNSEIGLESDTQVGLLAILILSYLPVHSDKLNTQLTRNHSLNIFPTLPVGNTLAACHVRLAPTARHLRSHSHLYFNYQSSAMTGESGEDGREISDCTGRYENISFITKTPYWHTQPVHLISPINNIYWRREALRHGTGSKPTSKTI